MSDQAPVLRVEAVTVRRGPRTILDGVGFSVMRGELVVLMGPSGSGKTTLLRTIAGLDPFDAGSIEVDTVALIAGRAPTRSSRTALRRRVGLVFQFHYLFEHLSVLKNVCLAPVHAYGEPQAEAETRALNLLRALGVEHRADALPRELSGGEAQRVAIARALAVNPAVLLMDEPTASLDARRKAEVGELLRRLTTDARTLLVATHDETFARDWATRIVSLTNGAVQ